MKKSMGIILIGALICCSLLTGCNRTVQNKQMSLKLAYGERSGTYTGEITLLEGYPNGSGRFETQDVSGMKWYYEGEFTDGTITGKGKCVWEDGQMKEGSYIEGEMVEGTVVNAAGIKIYEGHQTGEKYDGEGKFFNKKGDIVYQGKFTAGKPEKNSFISTCTKANYMELNRNPERYIRDCFSFDGKVQQVTEKENGAVGYRIAAGEAEHDVIYVNYARGEGEGRILENDMVTVYGMSEGLFTYDGTSGETITVPSMTAYYIDILSSEPPAPSEPPAAGGDGENTAVQKNTTASREEFLSRAKAIEEYAKTNLDTAVTQADMNRESAIVFEKWDNLLNEVYQYLKTTLTDSEFAALKKEEYQWIQQKEAEMNAAGAMFEGGSGEPLARNSVGIEYTSKRCYALIMRIQ